jgi:hypothetical protein
VTATPTAAGSGAHSTTGSNTKYYGSDAAVENWTIGDTVARGSSSSSSPGSSPATGDVHDSGNENDSGSESEQESAKFTRTGLETQYSSSTPAVPVPSSATSTPGVPAASIASSAPDALFTGAAPASAMQITYGQMIGSLVGCLLSMLVMLV